LVLSNHHIHSIHSPASIELILYIYEDYAIIFLAQ